MHAARDAVGEEAPEPAAAVLGRGGRVGLGGTARQQPRVRVGAETTARTPRPPRRGGGGAPRGTRLQLQKLQSLDRQAELLPDGAQAERPAAVAVLPAEADAPSRGGRASAEGGD
jgi:hypothetical protein